MNIGKLRHRIELQSAIIDKDDYGQQTENHGTYDTVWASVVPLTGRELEYAQQLQAETNYKITIRYNSAVKKTDQILFDDRIFEINAILNFEEKNEYLILLCKEAV